MEIEIGRVAEKRFGFRDIGLGMWDVAPPLRAMDSVDASDGGVEFGQRLAQDGGQV